MVDKEAGSPVSVCSSPNWVTVVLFGDLTTAQGVIPSFQPMIDSGMIIDSTEDDTIWEETGWRLGKKSPFFLMKCFHRGSPYIISWWTQQRNISPGLPMPVILQSWRKSPWGWCQPYGCQRERKEVMGPWWPSRSATANLKAQPTRYFWKPWDIMCFLVFRATQMEFSIISSPWHNRTRNLFKWLYLQLALSELWSSQRRHTQLSPISTHLTACLRHSHSCVDGVILKHKLWWYQPFGLSMV